MLKLEDFKLFTTKNIVLVAQELTFALGTFSYIQGSNSTGKSLFLNALVGQYQNYKGNITFKKNPLSSLKNNILLLNNELPVMKNLDFIENIQISVGKLGAIQKNRLLEMATTLGIVDSLKKKMEFSSRSERMFMYLTRAALISPSVLMIDDIDDYFDEDTFQKVYQVFTYCLKSGMLIISTGKSHVRNNFSYIIDSGEIKKNETTI